MATVLLGIEKTSGQDPDQAIVGPILDAPDDMLIQQVFPHQPGSPENRRDYQIDVAHRVV